MVSAPTTLGWLVISMPGGCLHSPIQSSATKSNQLRPDYYISRVPIEFSLLLADRKPQECWPMYVTVSTGDLRRTQYTLDEHV